MKAPSSSRNTGVVCVHAYTPKMQIPKASKALSSLLVLSSNKDATHAIRHSTDAISDNRPSPSIG